MSAELLPVEFPACSVPDGLAPARRRRPAICRHEQGELFSASARGVNGSAPCRLERDAVYDAVQKLRASGRKVLRISARQHSVNGRILTTAQLLRLANYVA